MVIYTEYFIRWFDIRSCIRKTNRSYMGNVKEKLDVFRLASNIHIKMSAKYELLLHFLSTKEDDRK